MVSASDQKQAVSAFYYKAACRKQCFVAAATLVVIIILAPAQAWPEKGLVTHKIDKNGKYTIVDFKQHNCKISGSLAEGLDLHACFAYSSSDANLISTTCLIVSNEVQIKKHVKCKLSENPNQALIFYPRYKAKRLREALASMVKSRNI